MGFIKSVWFALRELVAKLFAPVLLVVLLTAGAEAGTITLRAGSLTYHDPLKFQFHDGQVFSLVGERGFSFHGVVDIMQLNAGACTINAVWNPYCAGYATSVPGGIATGGTISGYFYPGLGLIGTATLDGRTFAHVGVPNSTQRIHLWTYGSVPVPAATATGNPVRSAIIPFIGEFKYGTVTETLTGKLLCTVEFEKYQTKWAVEEISFDFIP